jgi:hypothetical protein
MLAARPIMRTELQKRNGQRGEFTAVFDRYGRATVKIPKLYGRRFPSEKEVTTLLFKDVRDSTGKIVADHLWFKACKQWNRLGLRSGDKVKFEARVGSYEKGYVGRFADESERETDYKLAFPTKARLVEAFAADLPLLKSACPGCGQEKPGDGRFCPRCDGGRMD